MDAIKRGGRLQVAARIMLTLLFRRDLQGGILSPIPMTKRRRIPPAEPDKAQSKETSRYDRRSYIDSVNLKFSCASVHLIAEPPTLHFAPGGDRQTKREL